MKPRHAAALALVGCFLMVPPTRLRIGPQLSISRGELRGEFDSIRACEDARAEQITRARTDSTRIRRDLEAQEKWCDRHRCPRNMQPNLTITLVIRP